MALNVKLFTSTLSKYRSICNFIGYRCLSSKNLTLYDSIRTIECSNSKDVFIQHVDSLFIYPNRTSVYGGQIIGTATYAAQKTLTKDFPLHSLHAYFLTAVDNSGDVSYSVSRSRNGRSFQTRSVTVRQGKHIVFECLLNFHQREQGDMEHQLAMPHENVPQPETLPTLIDIYRNVLNDKRLPRQYRKLIENEIQTPVRIDIRYCHPRDLIEPQAIWPPRQLVWIKSLDPLPDTPNAHRAALAYISDRILMGSAFLPYSISISSPRIRMKASLDHSMWFHDDFIFDTTNENDTTKQASDPIPRTPEIPSSPSKVPVRVDDWLLCELECPVHRNHRALTLGRMWTRSGRLIVTCAQEGVIRTK